VKYLLGAGLDLVALGYKTFCEVPVSTCRWKHCLFKEKYLQIGSKMLKIFSNPFLVLALVAFWFTLDEIPNLLHILLYGISVLKVVTNEKGEAVGEVVTIIC
jgi:hypothetical protein